MTSSRSYSLPTPPEGANTLTLHFCKTFMHEFQSLRGADDYYRIYLAIEKTAARSGHAPELVAKTLVENGLRAGRESFPGRFVTAIESGARMPHWAAPVSGENHRELLSFWRKPLLGHAPANRRRRS
ncbi:MAG: hypothetical protein Q8K65_07880 [Alphaproteobacteria bacterium]|nr:hypothetical protein [Alphaproteobacteria bacterium]